MTIEAKHQRTLVRIGFLLVLSSLLILAIACSDSDDSAEVTTYDSGADMSDDARIQERLTEAITRWHYGDKAVLYDNEFEYLQDENSFPEYLGFEIIQWLEADTVVALEVQDVKYFNRDSADASVRVVFVGPSGDTSYDNDVYRMYYHRGRWIKPTISDPALQFQYEETRRIADSMAQLEAEMGY